jgi:hypothetical protein
VHRAAFVSFAIRKLQGNGLFGLCDALLVGFSLSRYCLTVQEALTQPAQPSTHPSKFVFCHPQPIRCITPRPSRGQRLDQGPNLRVFPPHEVHELLKKCPVVRLFFRSFRGHTQACRMLMQYSSSTLRRFSPLLCPSSKRFCAHSRGGQSQLTSGCLHSRRQSTLCL